MGTPPIFLREHPIRLRDTAGKRSKMQFNYKMHSLLSDSRLLLHLWNVRVEWHSWKYDFLLPLHSTFAIFVH